ncbi:MAG: ABC transporter permease [Lachnospiraceae bacterium]|nr:ABC transporter permease [Lachnospiraceae bacterium]
MFVKLAFRNVQRQIRNYLIYFITVTLCVALMFAVNNLCYSDRVNALADVNPDIRTMFNFVTGLACLVTALVLSYATGFMLKLRRKEFGMYLTLGMTRGNIQRIFACETGIISFFALLVGMSAGLVIFQLLVALFASVMEMPVTMSTYSVQGIFLTVAVSIGLFLLSTVASMRYLKRVTVSELLNVKVAQKSEKHSTLWYVLSALALGGLILCLIRTYHNLVASLKGQDGLSVLVWITLDLVLVFLSHAALSRSVTGMFLRSRRLKNKGTNVVVFRNLSEKMTMNSVLIGALATLLVFAMGMSNVALAEKTYSNYSSDRECPYDVMAQFGRNEEVEISKEQGEKIIEEYSAITEQKNYKLYTTEETTLSGLILGYDLMGWMDKFMPLSQFNEMLVECGYEPVTLNEEYMLVTFISEIAEIDYSNQTLIVDDTSYTWIGSEVSYPEFTEEWFYFVVPDAAIKNMKVSDDCIAYILENSRVDAVGLGQDLTYILEAEDGEEEQSNYRIKEDYRLFASATAGTLIIGTLYVSTVFVCMALAILSIKTLSGLDEEKNRFAILYRLGADITMQKQTVRRQVLAFFLSPFFLPIFATVPFGMFCGKVYEIWDFNGLSGPRAMEIAVLITGVIAGIYALYFFITYQIACNHVLVYGSEKKY